MISYQLGLELKNAGFPKKDFIVCSGENCNMAGEAHVFGEPTLSELIDACGDDFVELIRWDSNAWVAANCERDTPMIERGLRIEGIGSTPKIAVAMFYLELKKK